jgi:hypothetical protein
VHTLSSAQRVIHPVICRIRWITGTISDIIVETKPVNIGTRESKLFAIELELISASRYKTCRIGMTGKNDVPAKDGAADKYNQSKMPEV